MLKQNTSDSFPGADFVAADPVSSADCCKHQSVGALIAALVALGKPYTMRGGRLYFDQEAADQLTMCKGVDPSPTGAFPDPFETEAAGEVTGTGFDASEGKVWLGNAATYAGSSIKVEQTITDWADEQIFITAVRGELAQAPASVWVFVENACGRISSVGFEHAIEDPV